MQGVRGKLNRFNLPGGGESLPASVPALPGSVHRCGRADAVRRVQQAPTLPRNQPSMGSHPHLSGGWGPIGPRGVVLTVPQGGPERV